LANIETNPFYFMPGTLVTSVVRSIPLNGMGYIVNYQNDKLQLRFGVHDSLILKSPVQYYTYNGYAFFDVTVSYMAVKDCSRLFLFILQAQHGIILLKGVT